MSNFTWTGDSDGDTGNYLNYTELATPNSGDEVTVDTTNYTGSSSDPATGSASGNWTFNATNLSISGITFANGNVTVGSAVMFSGCTFPAYFNVTNYGTISGGTFNGSVYNVNTLSGGTFNSAVVTTYDITGGDFYSSLTFNTSSVSLSGATLESGSSVIADDVSVTNSGGNTGLGSSFSVSSGGSFSGFSCTWQGYSDQNLNNALNWDFCCLLPGNIAYISDAISSTYSPGYGTCNALLWIFAGSQGIYGGTYSDIKTAKDINGCTITGTLITDTTSNISLAMDTLDGATITADTKVITVNINNTYVGTTFATANGGSFIGEPGSATWTGAIDGNLNDIGNWDTKYPCATTGALATIPTSLTNYPNEGTAVCDFLIEIGGQISSKTNTNYSPTINGDIENRGTITYSYNSSTLVPSGTYSGIVDNYGSIDTGIFNIVIIHNGSSISDSGPSSPNNAQALFLNQLTVSNDISEINTSVTLTGITAIKVSDSIVFTKGKGLNGSSILGFI